MNDIEAALLNLRSEMEAVDPTQAGFDDWLAAWKERVREAVGLDHIGQANSLDFPLRMPDQSPVGPELVAGRMIHNIDGMLFRLAEQGHADPAHLSLA